ncbi:uncharacterized protein [Coffea arabica]|uniref:Retrotransposon gag domain-containing protein n=1 Tax=Coffea arabica TaxID=13443 RepID=A0A6P6SP33_COFAR|nr:uncharacterized protein LOC113693251 [Coffea arabica]
MDITSFSQQEGETLYEFWERYRELQRRCPHHGLPDWLVVQTFYNGFTYPTKTHVDAAAGGALMGKTAEEAQQLIEEMAANYHQWANERDNTRRTARVVVACCTTCGGDHDDSICSSSEQVQCLNNYNRPPQNNPYSNTYNSRWSNHPNFGWKDQGNQQRPVNPPDFQSKQPLPESKPVWKLAIEKLTNVSNDKIEKLASATTQRFERIKGRMDKLTNMYRNVEIQLGQIANAVNNRNQGDLPSKTEVNPRELVMAINLRCGKEVGELPVIEYERRENKQLSELGEDGQEIIGKEKMEENEPQMGNTTPIPPPIPSYAKFLKEIMTKKRKLVDSETIALTEECSAILQNKLPPKLKDPGNLTVPCTIGNVEFSKALCDLGANMEKDVNVPIILGRPFLATAGTIIDVKCGKFKFQIGKEEMEFNLSKVEKYPSFIDHVYSVDICDELALEMSQVNLDDDSLELCLNV